MIKFRMATRTGNTGLKIQMSLPVMVTREGEYFVAYTPALDLSSYGKTREKAQENFEEAIGIFLEEMLERGTLYQELLSLGWVIDKKKKTVTPPIVVEHTLTEVQIPAAVYA